jgi:prophage maintenance system killer protein
MKYTTFGDPLFFLINHQSYLTLILMIRYLSDKQIIELNKASLGITGEKNKFHLIQPDDLRSIMRFTEKNFGTNIIKKALAYCIAIIILHPFRNGNHRTSLLTAEEFLRQNNFQTQTTDQKDLE